MKKTAVILLSVLSLGLVATQAFAAGDKVRGDDGSGAVNQQCVHPDGSMECPFVG